MVIRIICILAGIICSLNSHSQGTEQQRKYVFSDTLGLDLTKRKTKEIRDLSVFYHSNYTYYDLYLESSDYLLYKNGYSLRFRKRILSDSLSSYAFQLKSEMTEKSEFRMEIEESELDFYKVKHGENWIPLTKVLDTLFLTYDKRTIPEMDFLFKVHNELIYQWIRLKAEAPIAPFQKLRHLDSVLFNTKNIQTLAPYLCGFSHRERGHVYIHPETSNKEFRQVPLNKIKGSTKPAFFVSNPDYNWILEVSLDYSEFRLLSVHSTKPLIINEFEVENKYMEIELGTNLMNQYELFLISHMNARKEFASKYKQLILQMQ